MAGARFSDVDWQRIWACPKDDPGIYVGQEAPTREFVEAVLWMARTGAPWRLLSGCGFWLWTRPKKTSRVYPLAANGRVEWLPRPLSRR
jgi:transposase